MLNGKHEKSFNLTIKEMYKLKMIFIHKTRKFLMTENACSLLNVRDKEWDYSGNVHGSVKRFVMAI